jgi:hypothetical protein
MKTKPWMMLVAMMAYYQMNEAHCLKKTFKNTRYYFNLELK